MSANRRTRRLLYSAAILVLVPLSVEGVFRALERPLGIDVDQLGDFRTYLLTGQLANYAPRAHTVFQRPSERKAVNGHGYSDASWSREKTANEVRVLCLGASTTEGGNPLGHEGSYPHLLELELQRRTGRAHRVMNAAISGWTSAEMLIAWFLLLRDFEPDVLVLHEGVSDMQPRFQAGFRADYSHWRRSMPSDGVHGLERWLSASDLYLQLRLQREGVPDIQVLTSVPRRPAPRLADGRLPPQTAEPFVRNMASIARDAESLGARVVLMTMPFQPDFAGEGSDLWSAGITEFNESIRELTRSESYDLVDAAHVFGQRAAELGPEFRDLVHLTPAGNQVKAELVADCLAPPVGDAGER